MVRLAAAYAALASYGGMLLPLRLVRGTSMEPTLHAGDVVLLRKVSASQLRERDLVAYRSPVSAGAGVGGRPTILHRVVNAEKTETGIVLTTRGDNTRPDPWPVTDSDVRGLQVFRIPAVGRPLGFLAGVSGPALASVGVLVALLAAATIFVLQRLRRRAQTSPAHRCLR